MNFSSGLCRTIGCACCSLFSPPFLLKPRPKQHFVSIQFCERKDFEGEQQISSCFYNFYCTHFLALLYTTVVLTVWKMSFWFQRPLKRWQSLNQTEEIEDFPLLFIRMLKVVIIYKPSLCKTLLIGWVRKHKGTSPTQFPKLLRRRHLRYRHVLQSSSNSVMRGCFFCRFSKILEKKRVGCYWEYQAEFLSSVLHWRT